MPGVSGGVRIQAALSLGDRVDAIREELWKRNSPGFGDSWYPAETHDDHIIARHGVKTYRIPYTIDADDRVLFGQAEEVEVEYVPVAASLQVPIDGAGLRLVGSDDEDVDPTGLEWEVDIIRAGESDAVVTVGGRQLPVFFTDDYVRGLVPLLANAPVYALDDTASGHKADAGAKLQGQSVGWTAGARYRAGVVSASLHFDAAGPVATAKRADLVSAWQRGNKKRFGLSIDSRGDGEIRVHAGREWYFATRPSELLSTDIVLRPAAGGGFKKLVAAVAAAAIPNDEDDGMNKQRLIAAIRASRPQILQGKDLETIGVAELATLANEAELRAAASAEAPATAGAAAAPAATAAAPATAVALSADDIARQVHASIVARASMEAVITTSRLPELAQTSLRRRMDQPGMTQELLQAAVDEQREILASVGRVPVQGLGGPAGGGTDFIATSVNAEPIDRVQAAFDRACGLVPVDTGLATIEPLGLRALYTVLTAGQDPSIHGTVFGRGQHAIQAAGFDMDSLPTVLANTMNRRLANEYAEQDYGESALVSVEGSATDFRPQTSVRLGYLGNLPSVDTDFEEYPEVSAYGEERVTWEMGERGMVISITRKHLINDDLGAVTRLPSKIARAGKRTFASFIFSFLKVNPVLSLETGDTLTWFHASRNNLMSDALSPAALTKARLMLSLQTEPDSAARIGLSPDVELHLWVPAELWPLAQMINRSEFVPGSNNNDANPWYRKFGENGERIHEVFSFTDANDWVMTVNPQERDILEVKFLNGQTQPQIVRQDAPGVGSVFTQGKIKMKAFHDFGGTPLDFRGVVKSVVAPPVPPI